MRAEQTAPVLSFRSNVVFAAAFLFALLVGLVVAMNARSAGPQLPDGRVYEMVSPTHKWGAEVAVPGNAGGQATFSVEPQQSSTDGEAVTYASFTSFGEAEGAPLTGQYLSRRVSDGIWSTANINPTFEEAFARDPLVGFSPDLSTGAVISLNPPLAAGAPADTWNLYRRDNGEEGYEALTRGKPEVFGSAKYCVGFAGASTDFGRVAFTAKGALIPGDPVANAPNLYEWHRQAADARQTLSVKATSGTYALTMTAAKGEGTLSIGSMSITGVEVTSAAGDFHVGDTISGTGIPTGTTVTAVGAGTLTISAAATAGGVQKLTATETTAPLSATDPAGTLQTALEALPAVGLGNVVVSGGPGDTTGSAPYVIEFGGDLAGSLVIGLKTENLSLAGGTPSSSAAVVITEPGGHLRLVSVLPNGTAATPNTQTDFGPTGIVANCNMTPILLRHAVSADGSRMFWTYFNATFPGGRNPLFAHVVDESEKAETIQLDASQGGTGKGEGKYMDASVDGSKVFFTSVQKLTTDSTAEAGKGDLYRYDFDAAPGARLTDLTVKPILSPGPAAVLGVLGTSETGDYVYFAASGILSEAPNSHGQTASTLEPNIYVWHEGTGIRFIASVPNAQPDNLNWASKLENHSARISPDGKHLSFVATKNLTGYDSTKAGGGVCQLGLTACSEVFLYSFEANEFDCVSCNPSGARPIGNSTVPGWATPYEQPRYLQDGGRLFFQSVDTLSPYDVNGKQDVYEFEAPGSGDCTVSSPAFGAASGGCVSLISHGDSSDDSHLLDASVDGRDVFFSTRQQLVPQLDRDGSFDVYDARIGGSAPPPASVPGCEGEGCRVLGAAPPVSLPGTSSFVGPSEAHRRRGCPKGKVRRKGRCVVRKHGKRHAPRHKRDTDTNRRTSR